MLAKLISTCVLAAALAGCLDNPMLLHRFEGTFEFRVTEVVPAPDNAVPGAAASGEAGRVVVTGSLLTGCSEVISARPGYVPAVQGLALELSTTPGGRPCDAPGTVVQSWRASFGVKPGTHRIAVRAGTETWVFDVTAS